MNSLNEDATRTKFSYPAKKDLAKTLQRKEKPKTLVPYKAFIS